MILIKFGSRGDNVKNTQEDLNALYPLDYPQLKLDGIFGNNTADWVRKFQRSNGLKVDGIVGPNTLGKLREKRPFKYKNAPIDTKNPVDKTNKPKEIEITPPDGFVLLGIVHFEKASTNIIKLDSIQTIAKKGSPRIKGRYYVEFGPVLFFVTGLASKEGKATFNKDLAERRAVFATQALYKIFTKTYSFKPQSFEIYGEGRGIGTAEEGAYEQDRRAAVFIEKTQMISLNKPLPKINKLTPKQIVEDRLAKGDRQMINAYDFISVNDAFINYYKALDVPKLQDLPNIIDWSGFAKGRFGDNMAIHTNEKFYKRVINEYAKQRKALKMSPLPKDLTESPK